MSLRQLKNCFILQRRCLTFVQCDRLLFNCHFFQNIYWNSYVPSFNARLCVTSFKRVEASAFFPFKVYNRFSMFHRAILMHNYANLSYCCITTCSLFLCFSNNCEKSEAHGDISHGSGIPKWFCLTFKSAIRNLSATMYHSCVIPFAFFTSRVALLQWEKKLYAANLLCTSTW